MSTHPADDAEFGEFAAVQWRLLVRSAVLLGNDVHRAEDLAQTTLLQCYLKWDRVQSASEPGAYVARMLINIHRQNRRRHWWRERPTGAPPEQSVPESTEQVLHTQIMSAALAALSAQHREVVVLRFFIDLTERQVADALGVPTGTVKSRLSRALARLSDNPQLSDLLPEGAP